MTVDRGSGGSGNDNGGGSRNGDGSDGGSGERSSSSGSGSGTGGSGRQPRIVCLGWGSLLWKPGELPLATGWQPGGPELPLEFARVGDEGELAIVLCAGAPDAPTYWAELDVDGDLARACELLRRREGVDPSWAGLIGSVAVPVGDAADGGAGGAADPGSDAGDSPWHARIAAWAKARGIEGVVWTALPPKSPGGADKKPSADEALGYLRALVALGDSRGEHAEHYVRQVPVEIRTPYREVIEERLGWTPYDAAARGRER